MSRLAVIAAGCALSACTFTTTAARNQQFALTALMAVDTAQTVTIARSSECLYEAEPLAAAAFGTRTPSPQRVLLTDAAYIAGHWMLGAYLDRRANQSVDFSIDAEQDIARKAKWRRLQRVYQWLTFIGHGTAVLHNQAKGIKPFSSYRCGVQP